MPRISKRRAAALARAALETAAWDAHETYDSHRRVVLESGERAIRRCYDEPGKALAAHSEAELRELAALPAVDHPAYSMLLEQCERTGYPQAFQADVTRHDRMNLSRADASAPFVWILRKNGSLLAWPERGDRPWEPPWGESWPAWIMDVFRTFSGDAALYLWDGFELRCFGFLAGDAWTVSCRLDAFVTLLARVRRERAAATAAE